MRLSRLSLLRNGVALAATSASVRPDAANGATKTKTAGVKNDRWRLAGPRRKTYLAHCLPGPTAAEWFIRNPAYAEARAQHVWGAPRADIIHHGIKYLIEGA